VDGLLVAVLELMTDLMVVRQVALAVVQVIEVLLQLYRLVVEALETLDLIVYRKVVLVLL
tara:strand:- start:420 stop:599 length:180 start_codon:yes stop_codon:yes gene_type:complete